MNDRSHAVVITGATRGLGRELSLAFGAAGYRVIGLYLSDSKAASDLAAEFDSRAYLGTFIQQDIAADGAWPEFDEELASIREREFTLVLNASAGFVPKPMHLIRQSELDLLLRVNGLGTLNVLNRVLPRMVAARTGVVVGILSSALEDKAKGFAAYVAAKSALQSLIESAAVEYADRGVKFVCVSPGFMETPLTDSWSPHLKASMSMAPLKTTDVAARIVAISTDPGFAGRGENYQICHERADAR